MNKEVVIYTWRTCPFCIRVKRLLEEKDVPYTEVEISRQKEMLSELKSKTGSGTVPQIFVDGTFIGGCDDVYALDRSGEFENIFK